MESETSAMAVPVRIPKGPLYLDINGFRVNTNHSLEAFLAALKYQPKPDDKFVVTFPKAGTTWTQQIGYLILHGGVPPSSPKDFNDFSPFLDIFGISTLDKENPTQFIKTHLPYNLVPKSPQARYLYVCRNPKDVCVSLFYHTRRFLCYEFADGQFEDFFDIFMNGETDDGDYFEHVLSWYEHRNDPNVMFINYEDMKAEPKSSILKIAEFMGKKHYKVLVKDNKMLDKVVECSGIDFMKVTAKDVFENLFPGLASDAHAPFIRKGIVGDWKEHFSPEMSTRMEEKSLEKLGHTDLIRVWKEHKVL